MNNFTSNKIDCATLKWMRHLLPSNALSTTLTDMLVEKEKDQPFLLRILEDKNINPNLKKTLILTQHAGAEVLSAYTNPFYWMHKAIQIPTNSQNVI